MTRRRDQHIQVRDEKTVRMPGNRSAMHPDGLGLSHAREADNRLHRERGGFGGSPAIREQRIDVTNDVPKRIIKCMENQ